VGARLDAGRLADDPPAVVWEVEGMKHMTPIGFSREQWNARISQIVPQLWVSEVAVRSATSWLRDFGIDTVVSILKPEQQARYDAVHPVDASVFRHYTFHSGDNDEIKPQKLDEIVEKVLGGVTLVHCVSGSNRSTCIAVACLLKMGQEPLTAMHRYFTQRGKSTASVYGVPPEMSMRMLTNLTEYWVWLRGGLR
jgi:hypothetical protein